jgi:phosphoribosylformylglycinamidine cyclo-ligase
MSERAPIQDVNIELGDDVSRMLYEASKLTHENRPGFLVEFHESFSGLRAIPGSVLNDPDGLYMNLGFDGVGTKVEISERLDDHSVVAHDLFAMVCDDAVVRGAEPVAIGSILDVRQLDDTERTREAVQQLGRGYVEAAKAAGVVVVNGEVAELGDRIGGFQHKANLLRRLAAFVTRRQLPNNFNYNWGAAVLWIAHKDRILTGHDIEPGDALVGFKESGFRSNGITDVRKAMLEYYGKNWHDLCVVDMDDGSTLGELVQKPSTIYSRLVTDLTGGYDIDRQPKATLTGVAHITGGGQPSKLGRMLEPSGYGAVICDPIDPPGIMLEVQEMRGFDDATAYGKWHMGPVMIVATPNPDEVIEAAQESGIEAQEIGCIDEQPGIKIKNRGAEQQEEWLHF